jgi:hypothetical protein
MIPVKFVMKFANELSDVATLTTPNGHLWQMGLEKENREIWFDDGWQEFMGYHSIPYGYILVSFFFLKSYFLVFKYERNGREITHLDKKWEISH